LRKFIDTVGTEVFSPFILATVMLIGVPVASTSHWVWQAIVGVAAVVVIPWGLSLWLAHSGKTSDRWLVHRRQRYGFYGVSVASIAAGAVILLIGSDAAAVKALIGMMLAAVATIALINFKLKTSAHACMAAIFGTVMTGFFGPWWLLIAVVVQGVVCYSRWHMKKHTVAELVVGTVVGFLAGLSVIALA
jgi:membrane-associated HD superfamily phosphohydrolase